MKQKMKQKPQKINYLFLISIFLAVLILDRITKIIFTKGFCAFIFCIKPSINDGAAFGILSGSTLALIIAAFVIILLVIFLFRTDEIKKSRLIQFALVLIISGAIGNLIDRIAYGYVLDWLTFSFFNFSSFNLADIASFAGAVILLVNILRKK